MANIFTDANFQAEVTSSAVPVLVDFWAPWCGPCRAMSPIVEEIASQVDASKLKVGTCNVDENGTAAQTYGVMSIPTFLVIKNGEVVERIVGSMPKDSFVAKLQPYIS